MNAFNKHWRSVVAITAPCIVIGGMRLFGGGNPQSATAAVLEAGAAPVAHGVTPAPLKLDPATIASLRAAETLTKARIDRSPMDHPPAVAAPKQAEQSPPVETPRAPGEFRVTAMLGSGDNAAAVINGRVVRVGDRIADAQVLAIDTAAMTVDILLAGNERKTLTRR